MNNREMFKKMHKNILRSILYTIFNRAGKKVCNIKFRILGGD